MTEEQLALVFGGYLEYPQKLTEQGIEDFVSYRHCTIVKDDDIKIIKL